MDNAAAILHQNSGATAYNTPADIVDVGRCLVGGAFDLDPASNEFANSYIRAKTYYTEEMNGINLPWGGRIWVNQKGICTCPCHSESVKLAGTHIQNHLIISTGMGGTSGTSASTAVEKRQEWFRFVADAESLNLFIRAFAAKNASIDGLEREATQYQQMAMSADGLAVDAWKQSLQLLSILTEGDRRGMDCQVGAENATKSMPERRVASKGVPRRERKSTGSVSLNIERPNRGEPTSEREVALTGKSENSARLVSPSCGQYQIGRDANENGISSALTVESQESFHKIISFLSHHPIALEQSKAILSQLATLAIAPKVASPLLSGAKMQVPWKLSFDTSPTCEGCGECCCVRYPNTVWCNHPFANKERACGPNCKKKICEKRGHCTPIDIPGNADWIDKLVESWESGDVTAACSICFAATSENWFAPLSRFPQFYFTGRVNYILPDGTETDGVLKGSVLTLLPPKSMPFDLAGTLVKHLFANTERKGTVKVAI